MGKAKVIPYSQDELKELLDYNPESGELIWKERGNHWFSRQAICNNWNGKHAGKRAGYEKTSYSTGYKARYMKLPYSGDFLESRVIWVWMTGEQPPEMIDHFDRDATNNVWENIRASNQTANMHNMSKYKSNRSGFTGVFWCKDHSMWRVCINHNKVRHHLGRFEDINEAAEVAKEFRKKNGFTEGHGKEIAHYLKEK